MNIQFISLRLHVFGDFLFPVTLAGAPLLFEFPQSARWVAFTVAAVHLSMSLLTDYPGGLIKLIPFRLHLLAELIFGPGLVATPWVLHFTSNTPAFLLCTGWGIGAFLSYFVTQRTPALPPPE